MELKRGYYKWTDDDGVKHKVLKEEYEAMNVLVVDGDEEYSEEELSESESD